jgi:hypothetical protein
VPIPTPPPRQLALSLVIERLRLTVPQWVGLVVLAVLVPSGAWMALGDSRGPPLTAPTPVPVPQVPVLVSTPAALPMLAMVLPGVIPPPGPNQLRAGKCDRRGAEVELNGGCWMQTTTAPPCPEGVQWEHNGKCWRPVGLAREVPTTGEPRTLPVASPAD